VTATYSKRLDSGELLDNSFLLRQVGGTDSQSGGCNDGQTDGDTDDKQNQNVVKQVDGAPFWCSDAQIAEEATNP